MSNTTQKSALKPLDVVAQEVLDGKWGNGAERKQKLEEAGYSYDILQRAVNRMTVNLDEVATKVIRGDYGNGAERIAKLEAEGFDAAAVQARVDELLK